MRLNGDKLRSVVRCDAMYRVHPLDIAFGFQFGASHPRYFGVFPVFEEAVVSLLFEEMFGFLVIEEAVVLPGFEEAVASPIPLQVSNRSLNMRITNM